MPNSTRPIAFWLFLCCFMVAAMVWLGGVTRLTNSGLSITEWKPVTGILPPLSEEAWVEEKAKYKQSPEYQKINFGMTLPEFKQIYWMEYSHRLLGRLAGAVFLLPFLYFLATKRIGRLLAWKLAGIFVLGGVQGAMGWYMVKSGLVDHPDVSQYRLTAHLLIAFLIYGLLFLTALSQWQKPSQPASQPAYFRLSAIITLLIVLQVAAGGFVAGLNAGLVYNSFPSMNGEWVPGGLLVLEPWYKNFLENPTAVQFMHRIMAYIVAAAIALFWLASQRRSFPLAAANGIHLLAIVMVLQFCLGVATLLFHVPVFLGSLHQMGALLLFSVALYVNYVLYSGR